MDLFGDKASLDHGPSLKKNIQKKIFFFDPNIGDSWREVLSFCFHESKIRGIKKSVLEEIRRGTVIYPLMKDIFNAYISTSFESVKVVILGQDPYHGLGQAHGLSFSVPKGINLPPSLQNIFRELSNDIGILPFTTGNLSTWAKQGVFLLNTILTVKGGVPASHRDIGWEVFTDYTIKALSDSKKHTGIVFVLWGRYAQKKKILIDQMKHLVLEAAHPSPFSASNGFFGCKHFSQINKLLLKQNKTPIDWLALEK